MPTLKNLVFHSSNGGQPAIFDALDELGAMKLRMPVPFKIRQLRRALSTRRQDFKEIFNDAIKRLGEKTEDGFTVKPGSPEWDTLQAEYRELITQEFDVDVSLTLEELEGALVSADTLEALGDILELPAKIEAA